MRLVPIPQSSASRTLFSALRLGPWELGPCVAFQADRGFCSALVRDDGTGYADLDGPPFSAYVCKACAEKLLAQQTECPL